LPLDQYGLAGPAGIEPAWAGLRPAANPSQLETLWSGSEDSNPVCLLPKQARLPLRHIPVEMAGIEPAATTLAGRVRCLSCHPQTGRRGGPAGNGAHAMDMSTSKHVHPWVVLRRDRRS
jgi:hypothetical protein